MSVTGELPLIGAQLSAAGGFLHVPQRAVDIGAEAVQIFNTNPRIWRPRVPAPGEIEAFATCLREHRLPLFLHSTYLINLASPDDELRRRSSEALAFTLTTGALAGAEAVVTHVGSHRGEAIGAAERRVMNSIREAVTLAQYSLAAEPASGAPEPLAATGGARQAPAAPALPALLLETGTGAGNTLGGRLEQLATLLSLEETLGLSGALALGICIDTAHLFAAGYAVHEEAGLEGLIERLRALGLLERIGLVHLNDSKTSFGVRRDQHENLGEGLIGYEGLARVVRHPALVRKSFVLEVPGADGHGPDAANVALAKSMRVGARNSGRPRGRGATERPQGGEAAPAPPVRPAPAGSGRERPA
jgi:deoxyribonuclease IV